MPNQFTSAAIRAVIATALVVVWVVWYDGPPWAWALLVGYIAFTVGIAFILNRKYHAAMKARKGDPE